MAKFTQRNIAAGPVKGSMSAVSNAMSEKAKDNGTPKPKKKGSYPAVTIVAKRTTPVPLKKAPRDMVKYNATVDVNPGEKLSKDPEMRKAQDAKARKDAEAYKAKYGVYPTAANVKKYGTKI
jgi:hypothetical protein